MNRPPSETLLLVQIRSALLETGRVLLWRNNSGRLRTDRGRRVQFGLGLGSPDLIGILRPDGRLFAVEVKTEAGRLSPEQLAWHRAAEGAGALVVVARSVEDALSALPET